MSLRIEQEIHEQPEVIRRLLTEQAGTAATIAEAVRQFKPTFVCIAARGTSDNAARYAQYLFGTHLGLTTALAAPSLHTFYHAKPDLSRALVIGISQSGAAEDVRQVLSDARSQGALTVSITNNDESPLAKAADYHLAMGAGQEISVAATKTYTAELTAVAMLVTALASEYASALETLPELVAQTIEMVQDVPVERYRYMQHFVSIGRGYNYSTAFEISLKIQELCYVMGTGYSEADFLHGPIAMLQPGFTVIAVAPSGQTLPTMLDLLVRLKDRQAETIVISDNDEALAHAQNPIRIPSDIPEWLTPIAAIIPGQFFAMRLALAKGHSVDQPRGLTKVTVTK